MRRDDGKFGGPLHHWRLGASTRSISAACEVSETSSGYTRSTSTRVSRSIWMGLGMLLHGIISWTYCQWVHDHRRRLCTQWLDLDWDAARDMDGTAQEDAVIEMPVTAHEVKRFVRGGDHLHVPAPGRKLKRLPTVIHDRLAWRDGGRDASAHAEVAVLVSDQNQGVVVDASGARILGRHPQ